jgi:hypothetical protein
MQFSIAGATQRGWDIHLTITVYLSSHNFPKNRFNNLTSTMAVCFLKALKAFINTLPHGCQFFELNAHDHFGVYSNLVLFLPPIEHGVNKHSRIHSLPQCCNGAQKPPTLARYDTVLVEVNREL